MAKSIIDFSNPMKVQDLAKKWGQETKGAIAFQLATLNLKDKGDLINSIGVKIKKRFGEVEAVRFEYLYYGLFHDVGAQNVFGKGVSLPAQNWKAAAINPKIEGLADKLAEYYAELAIKNIQVSNTK